MNVEFHYYSTAFLAVKAGFPLKEATTLAYSSQYIDHHHRALEISTPRGRIRSAPTQNFSFWDQATVSNVLAPFHFFPSGPGYPSVRVDAAVSVWDVRPNSPGAKTLLLEALKTRNLYRIGLALHTFCDTWAHQNFTARNEGWNRLEPGNRIPAPGHAQAGFAPDLWLARWEDPRLRDPQVTNLTRFAEAARKVYRYLCTFRGKDFRSDEEAVAEELLGLVEAGRGREALEDRIIEFVLALNLEPYDKGRWPSEALEPVEEPSPWPILDRWKKVGEDLMDRTGLSAPQKVRAKAGFESSDFAGWIQAAEAHRTLAQGLVLEATGGSS